MLKIEGAKFNASTFEPTVASRQFASTATKDNLASSKPAEETEGCFYRMLCCFPRLLSAIGSTILAVVSSVIRTAICILTLGYYCNTKAAEKPQEVAPPSEKDLRAAKIKDLEEGMKVWEKNDAKPEEKGAARDEMEKKYPKVFEEAAILEVERLRLEYTLKKPENPEDAKFIKEWNEAYFDTHKMKKLDELVNGFNVKLLSNYIEHLRKLNAK
jgi:hypothetical protein